MAREVRHPLTPAADQDGPLTAAPFGHEAGATEAHAASLDPLVRALDRAITRSARTGYGGTLSPP